MDFTSRILNTEFLAKAESLHDLRRCLRDTLFKIELSSKQVDPLILAVSEACANIIEHGYDPNPDPNPDPDPDNTEKIILEVFFNDNEITFQLTDFAKPIDPTTVGQRDLDDIRPKGLGIHFMREIMDEVTFSSNLEFCGNILTMKKQFEEKP